MYGFHEFSWFMPISMIIFWGAIIYFIFAGSSSESAIDIAKRRFASGDINEEQLNDIKKKL